MWRRCVRSNNSKSQKPKYWINATQTPQFGCRLIAVSGLAEGCTAGEGIFFRPLKLCITLFLCLVMCFCPVWKPQRLPATCSRHSHFKTMVPYKLYVKGPVTFDWLSAEGWIWFFSFSDARVFLFSFWQQETELFISQKDTHDSY